MRENLFVVGFILFQFLWKILQCADCPYEECSCATTAIFCEGKGLHSLPKLVTKKATIYTALELDDNQITTIQEGALPPNLTQLSLKNNPIANIDDLAFVESATTLTVLMFSKPRFTRLPNALLHLRNLQELQIGEVGGIDWNVEVMKNIGSTLQILYLENVNFTSSPNWLQYLCCLTELNIIESNLNSIPDNALDKMAHTLNSVSLDKNLLTEVPKALSKLSSVVYLDLPDNKITSTKWLPVSTFIKSLSLNGNQIYNSSELSISLRPYGNTLVDFTIADNKLVSIPDLSFLSALRSLSFVDNRITDYSSGSLPSELFALDLENNLLRTIPKGLPGLEVISTLVLKSNRIEEIQGQDFPPKANVVILAFNLITELNDNSFPENSILESLYLNNNPIHTISPRAFANLNQLEVLSLQGTQLTRLPLALSSLVDLTSLDVSDIPGLVCTCLEKDLAAWIMGPKIDNLQGDCGETSVHDFFAILSPGCPAM